MRKFLLRVSGFGAAIALLLCCCACGPVTGLEASYSDTSNFAWSSDAKRPLLSTLINNEDSYDSLITAEVDIHDFAQKFCVDSEHGGQIFGQVSLAKIHDGIGIECLRETPEGALYSVHKVKQGGLLYLFFDNNEYNPPTEDTRWHRHVRRWFYVRENLSLSDFSGAIENKGTLEDFKRVDATTQVFENIYLATENYWEENLDGKFQVWHYLEDGLLEVAFQKNKEGEQAFLLSLYEENFDLRDVSAARDTPYNARVFDKDRVK